MFRISSVTEAAAKGSVKKVYDELKDSLGIVPNVFKALSLWPEGLELYVAMVKGTMFADTKLTRAVKEMIASTVSRINQCDYCVGHHKNFMTQYGISSTVSEQVVNDPQSAEYFPRRKKIACVCGKGHPPCLQGYGRRCGRFEGDRLVA